MRKLRILFTSAGRRVGLIRSFRQAIESLSYDGAILTADLRPNAPASFVSDKHILAPIVSDRQYIDFLFEVCLKNEIDLVVPLIDTELEQLAHSRERFEASGVHVLVSSPEVIRIANDKRTTHQFFQSNGIDTPRMLGVVTDADLPVLLKPASGSASIGVNRVADLASLDYFRGVVEDSIVQELIVGTEYTIDVLVDRRGVARSVVPRRRIETRAGEVSKGVTEKSTRLIVSAKRVVEALPGAYGPITVQCFLANDDRLVFIEINPRFGGGFPLSHAAGADFPKWILQWVAGEDPEIGIDDWQDELWMLRYDEAIFATTAEVHRL